MAKIKKIKVADTIYDICDADALHSHQTIKQDGITGATANRYGVCSTAVGTAAKTVSITKGTFSLETGARVTVKFGSKNTANNPTLNVNSTGAKNIFHNGAQITSGTNKGMLYGTVDFVYDGTQWHLVGNYVDTDTNTHNSHKINSGKKSDGSTDIVSTTASSGDITLGDSGVTAGTYRSVTVNSKGIVVAGSSTDSDTNTWRKIQLNGTDKLGTGTNTNPLNIKAGSNMTITESNGTFTFTATNTDTDTHYTTGLFVGATNTKSNAATANGSTYLKLYDNDTKRAEFKISGSGATTVTSDANGNIVINSTDNNTDTNTSHTHDAGVGLVGSGSDGISGGKYTYKAKLRSETALTIDSAAATTTSGRVYPVAVDKSGYLSVNVPWTDANTDTNQKVKAGSVTFGANDEVNIVAGDNVTVTGDATNKKITIKATDTNTWRPIGTGATDAAAGNHTHNNYLGKTTYEWNKEFAAGQNGAISLGRYNMYDTQLTFDITSTTTQSLSGKLVIATQNGSICQARVFGDTAGTLTSKLVIYQSAISGSRSWIEVFCNFDGWSKNKVHIYAVALNSATVEKQMNSITMSNGVPATANVTSGDTKWSGTIINDSNHTHVTSIAKSTGTNQLTLEHNTKYAITAGGQSFVFTTPSDDNTDEKVKQNAITTENTSLPVLLAMNNSGSVQTGAVNKTSTLLYNPSTGTLSATNFSGAGANLSSLNASNLSSGTVPENRLTKASTTTYGIVKTSTGLSNSVGVISVTYGSTAGTACQGNDSRLTNARTPVAHDHGNITNGGTISSTAVTSATGVLVYDSSNKIQRATAENARSIIGAAASDHTHTTNSTFYLDNNNYVHATGFYAQSDKRLKENIKEFTPQKSILDLPVVEFDYIETKSHNIGCIAQDLQEICPEIVNETEEGYLSIEEDKLVYLLLLEVKKLKAETEILKNKLEKHYN